MKVSDATEEEMEKLNKTTVHNLAEERSVGSINNELKNRGKGNLECASRKLILNKSFDLLEKRQSKDYLKFRKPAQAVSALKADWKDKMQSMEIGAFAEKEKVNMHLDSVRYKDLEFLKSKGGPFTTLEEVEIFMNQIKDSKEENHNQRLYIEVRYAKNTSLRLKHSDPVFRLRRDNKNLSNREYSENLKTYLGSARKTTTISVSDLSDVISKITGVKKNSARNPEVESALKPGEHVAVYWIEDSNEIVWYLGIVEHLDKDNIPKVIHLKQTDKKGLSWIIPDEPEKLDVEDDQIVARDISVIYHGVSCRIELSKATAKHISDRVEQIKKNLLN